MKLHEDRLELQMGKHTFQLPLDTNRFAVTYTDKLTGDQRRSLEFDSMGEPPPYRYEIPQNRITIVDRPKSLDPATIAGSVVDNFQTLPEVETLYPVYSYFDKRVLLPQQIAVSYDPDIISAKKIATEWGLQIHANSKDLLVLRIPVEHNVIELANRIDSLPGVNYAEPDLITIGSHARGRLTAKKFSPRVPDQIQPGFRQIALTEAWKFNADTSKITVAVLDDGVDDQHPALQESIVGKFDAITGTLSSRPNDWDYHGTACAGVIAARHDDAGNRGIAHGASLLAIRIAQSPGAGLPWATSSSIIRQGIDWAINRGADVLSNSWGAPPSNIIREGITRGVTIGREGKGALFVFAAGNSGGPVEFPASLSGSLAIGAVNLQDEHKDRDSSDGEHWWASNVGTELDLTAPGVGIHTTDIGGLAGDNPEDWRSDFNGTSAACPVVAGVAALMFALKPYVSSSTVSAFLTESSERVDNHHYDQWHHDYIFGHGRINAAAAMTRLSSSEASPPEPTPTETGNSHHKPALKSIRGQLFSVKLSQTIEFFGLTTNEGENILFSPKTDDRELLALAAKRNIKASIRYDSIVNSPLGDILISPVFVRQSESLGTGTDDPTSARREPGPMEVLLPHEDEDVFKPNFGRFS